MTDLPLTAILKLGAIIWGWIRAYRAGDDKTLEAVDSLLLTAEERKAQDEAVVAATDKAATVRLKP